MAQNIKQSDKFAFTVETVPSLMRLPNGSIVPDGFFTNRRTDTHEVLGKVTDRYGLIQNQDLIGAAEDAFAAKSMTDFKRKIVVVGEGQKMYARYDFRSHIKKLKVGDEVGLSLTVQNSFDGGLRASFSLGMLRLICLNGAATLEREVSMTKKHSVGISSTFIGDALEKAILAWDKATAVYDRLAQVGISQVQGINILAQLEASKALSGKLREAVEVIWNAPRHAADADRNLFNLYNALTQHLTHDVSATRFELANRTSENVLTALARASRDADRLTALSQPVALPVTSVIVTA
jgi:hypothetical protein